MKKTPTQRQRATNSATRAYAGLDQRDAALRGAHIHGWLAGYLVARLDARKAANSNGKGR